MIIKSISRVELIKINGIEHDEFDLNTGKSIKWPIKLSAFCNLAPQSFNCYKVAP
jgi:hypothetical protein